MEEETREPDGAQESALLPKEHAALFNTHIGAEVALWRKVLGMDQGPFAQQVGIERSRLSKIENGKLAARADELLAVAKLVGVSYVDFIQPAYLRYHGQISPNPRLGRPDA